MTKFTSILLFVLFLSCNDVSENKSPSNEPTEVNVEESSYLALGDSYTIGESVEESQRWPVQLVEELRERGLEVEDPKIIARTGWTTEDLLNAMEDQLAENEQYDLVSVSIGVNNQYQGKSIEAYEEDLYKVLMRAIELSKKGNRGLFVVSIPNYGVTPFGASNAEEIGKEIEEFNAAFKRVANQYNLDFYNITPISERAEDRPELTAEDGLHPSGEMYGLWVEDFVDEMAEKLRD